jgi:hypothetical protein
VIAPLARDALTVVVGGEEAPGLIAYGLTAPGGWRQGRFPADAWPAAPEADEIVLHGEGWRVYAWEVPVVRWPGGVSFTNAVRRTLEALTRGGCAVAWAGAEGLPFCDPPGLFDPACMSGGVLAWMTDDGQFACPLDPDRALSPVSDAELLKLRRYALGLADAR